MNLEERRKNLSAASRSFLLEILSVIERHSLDFHIPDSCIGMYCLRNNNPKDFIEITHADLLPYELVYKSIDLSVAIKLMLGIAVEVNNSEEDILCMQRENED